MLSLCLGSYYVLDPLAGGADAEREYSRILKPLLGCLCTNPELPFCLYLSGEAMDWLNRKHPEFFVLARELLAKKTLELLGGGFFAPFFPFIPPADRLVQLEMLTTVLRQSVGKRPRGAWLPASAWDSALVPVLAASGIEYVLLDRHMLKYSGCSGVDGNYPVTVEENGKTVAVLPLETAAPDAGEDPRAFAAGLLASVGEDACGMLACFFPPDRLADLASGAEPWICRLQNTVRAEKLPLMFETPARVLRAAEKFQRPAVLSDGMAPAEVRNAPEDWPPAAVCKIPVKQNLLHVSPFIPGMYAKMMHVHTLINQIRGDKARKNAALEELCRAQNHRLFVRPAEELPAARACVYRRLLTAEKLSRQKGIFSDSLLSFDYDFDGVREYLAQTEILNLYLHPSGGRIFECDVFSSGKNFCGAPGRMQDPDAPERFLFTDYFLSREDLPALRNFCTGVFPQVFSSSLYQEESLEIARKEVVLKVSGVYGAFDQPVSLKKRFLFKKNGVQVQFILKNDSPLNLSGVLATGLGFALSLPKKTPPSVSVFAGEARHEVPDGLSLFTGAEWLLICDADSGVRFNIEANESPDLALRTEETGPAGAQGFRAKSVGAVLYWPVDLSPGYETEKTVFLTIKD